MFPTFTVTMKLVVYEEPWTPVIILKALLNLKFYEIVSRLQNGSVVKDKWSCFRVCSH